MGFCNTEKVVFNNSYKASGSATINGTKTVTYRDTEVKAEEFTFLLKEGDKKLLRSRLRQAELSPTHSIMRLRRILQMKNLRLFWASIPTRWRKLRVQIRT